MDKQSPVEAFAGMLIAYEDALTLAVEGHPDRMALAARMSLAKEVRIAKLLAEPSGDAKSAQYEAEMQRLIDRLLKRPT